MFHPNGHPSGQLRTVALHAAVAFIKLRDSILPSNHTKAVIVAMVHRTRTLPVHRSFKSTQSLLGSSAGSAPAAMPPSGASPAAAQAQASARAAPSGWACLLRPCPSAPHPKPAHTQLLLASYVEPTGTQAVAADSILKQGCSTRLARCKTLNCANTAVCSKQVGSRSSGALMQRPDGCPPTL